MRYDLICIFLVGSLFLSSCTQPEASPTATPIKVQLKWLHQAQFAGNYVAIEKGFYKEKNLDVTLIPFNFEDKLPIQKVEDKDVKFAITGADELILAKAQNKAPHVKAIAVIYQINPVTLYSLKESGIDSPEDFIGKTVGIERASDGTDINIGILYYAMMKKVNVDRQNVTEVTIGYDATELLAGETDVSSGYITNEPQQAIEAGYEINLIKPSDYGVDMYADVIIVNQDTIDENPALVKDFLDATLQGWEYALENQEEAVNITLRYAIDRTIPHEAYMLKESAPLIKPTSNTKIGQMDFAKWYSTARLLIESGLLDKDFEVRSAYDTRFIE